MFQKILATLNLVIPVIEGFVDTRLLPTAQNGHFDPWAVGSSFQFAHNLNQLLVGPGTKVDFGNPEKQINYKSIQSILWF